MNKILNYFENANNILPGNTDTNTNVLMGTLWLGNYKAALDPTFLKNNNISVIINCSEDIPYIFDIKDMSLYNITKLETFRIPVNDSLLDHDIYKMLSYMDKVIPFLLKKLLTEKKNILVHCYAGRQRSAKIIAALLYVLISNNIIEIHDVNGTHGELMHKIIKYILKKRSQAFSYGTRINFKHSLEEFFNIKF